MLSPLKKPESMYDIIFEAVTKKREAVQETARKCKQLFKQGANPKTLAELEEILRERQDEQTITKQLKSSKQGTSPEALAKLKESLKKQREDYECYIQHFLPALLREITQSKKLDQEKAKEIGRIISEITSKSSNKYSKIEEQPINSIKEEIPVSSTGMTENNVESLMTQDQTQQKLESLTKEEVCVSDSDSGINSPGLASSSRRSSLTLVTSTSSEERLNSIPSVAEENNNLQKENENQMQPEQTAPEEPQVQESVNSDGQANPGQVKEELSQVSPQRVTKVEESKTLVSATQMTGGQTQDSTQPEEKRDRKNATTTVQKFSVNKKKGEDIPLKQPNNRNLHVALVAGCALSTIGCIVAGAMTSGLVGAGLLAMAAVFAIAAVAELHSNFLSSKLTSINVEPLVDDKKLTACSHL
ncbi:hypothetical protein [Wolbachia endosymbiont (group A) of Rhinocyllus conicus]|uniref:hypothetical protein n=1 Tax=Wolbachia endosymbiont (group A) of Rhinocyllus conicus TaxID=2954053 RepID=UPI002227AA3A|nr:hypothetical protein [Wolbachia endosymbiont (group A) of Rhinocyllus conicus]